MRIFERWYFWLVLTLENSYRVYNILKDFGFFQRIFWRLYFCMVKYLSFHNSSFALRYFYNVNGKATSWHTPCFLFGKKIANFDLDYWRGAFYPGFFFWKNSEVGQLARMVGCGLFSKSHFVLETFDNFLSKYGKILLKKSQKNLCKIHS